MLFYIAVVFVYIFWIFFRFIYFYFCQTVFLVSILNNVASTEYWFFRCFIFFSTIDGSFLLLGLCLCIIGFLVILLFFRFSALYIWFLCFFFACCLWFCSFSFASFCFFDAFIQDGYALNAVLRNPIILVHPPFLYFSLAVVFSLLVLFSCSATYRTFFCFSTYFLFIYLFLTALLFLSICLGGFWAYFVLGWGGWWFWDPVEIYAALFCIFLFLRIHSFTISARSRLLYGWFLQEWWFLAILFFYLSVGLFFLRAGLIASIHNFVLDFSSSWLFFFLGNFMLLVLFFCLFRYFSRFFYQLTRTSYNLFFFFCNYLAFNYILCNSFLSFFFNYILFQEFFLFLNIGSIFTFSFFFFFMWILSRRLFSLFAFFCYSLSFWLLFTSEPFFSAPLIYVIILIVSCFIYLYLFCWSNFTYTQGLHSLFLLLSVLVLLNKFFSCLLVLPIYPGVGFILFNQYYFLSSNIIGYNAASIGVFFYVFQLIFSNSWLIVSQMSLSFLYSFFSGLLLYENAVFSFVFYDLQLFLVSTTNIFDQEGFDYFYLCKFYFSFMQGVLWGCCFIWVGLILSWIFFLFKRIFFFK